MAIASRLILLYAIMGIIALRSEILAILRTPNADPAS
jgi:hypothetical protein